MRTYYVQLTGCDQPFYVQADDNPTTQDYIGHRNAALVFKRSDEIVAQFMISAVVGWWYNTPSFGVA